MVLLTQTIVVLVLHHLVVNHLLLLRTINYYYECGSNVEQQRSSIYLSNPLWDGQGCPAKSGCCAQLGMPWFYRRTPVPLSKNIEVRICEDQGYDDEDTAIEKMAI